MKLNKGSGSVFLSLFASMITLGGFFVSSFLANPSFFNNSSQGEFQVPEEIKSVYLTSWSANTEGYLKYVIDLAERTEINAVVIDIKDWSGYVFYDTSVKEAEEYGAEKIFLSDIEKLIERFHNHNIAVIARIVVFQDPVLAAADPSLAIKSKEKTEESNEDNFWLDKNGLAWVDPSSEKAWDYNIKIAKDAFEKGFDEVNFDYIRFPSDGDLKDMIFPFFDKKTAKHIVIGGFFEHLREELKGERISVDLFGLTTMSYNDLGVGQIIEDAFLYFDFVCPMVYPSHFAFGFEGLEDPEKEPYKVVFETMKKAKKRLKLSGQKKAKLRPWLQDFDLKVDYDEKMVREQIEAVYDALGDDFSGFMLWSSDNIYTEKALKPEFFEVFR